MTFLTACALIVANRREKCLTLCVSVIFVKNQTILVDPLSKKFKEAVAVASPDDTPSNADLRKASSTIEVICELVNASTAAVHPDATLAAQEFLTHTFVDSAVAKCK